MKVRNIGALILRLIYLIIVTILNPQTSNYLGPYRSCMNENALSHPCDFGRLSQTEAGRDRKPLLQFQLRV